MQTRYTALWSEMFVKRSPVMELFEKCSCEQGITGCFDSGPFLNKLFNSLSDERWALEWAFDDVLRCRFGHLDCEWRNESSNSIWTYESTVWLSCNDPLYELKSVDSENWRRLTLWISDGWLYELEMDDFINCKPYPQWRLIFNLKF